MKTDFTQEEWKDIEGYEGLYQISSFGRVKRLARKGIRRGKERVLKELIMKPVEKVHGYLSINLYLDGKLKGFQIHRLVAIHFLNNEYNFKVVNHKDGNPKNNCLENLEWCDQLHNIRHSYGVLQRKNKHIRTLTEEQVLAIDQDLKKEKSFASIAREHGATANQVRRIAYGMTYNDITKREYKGRI